MSVQTDYKSAIASAENPGSLSGLARKRVPARSSPELLNLFVSGGRFLEGLGRSKRAFQCEVIDGTGKRVQFIAKEVFPEIPEQLPFEDFLVWIRSAVRSKWKELPNPECCVYTYEPPSKPPLPAIPEE